MNIEEKKLENTIFLRQGKIYELEDLKEIIKSSNGEEVRFKIKTKHWYGYSEPFLCKDKSTLDITKQAMITIIDTAIEKEKERIDKCIDMLITSRQQKEAKKWI